MVGSNRQHTQDIGVVEKFRKHFSLLLLMYSSLIIRNVSGRFNNL